MTSNDDKKEGGFPAHTHYRCASLNNKTGSNDGSKVINLLIQACKKKDYDCKIANHGAEIILKKRLEKTDYGLVVKINQT